MNTHNRNTLADTDHASLIHQLFEHQLKKTPDAIAIAYKGYNITYAQLNQAANNLAAIILQSSASAIIGVSTYRCIETIIGILAILKTGKAYLPLDPDYPKERLEQIISDSGIDTCIATQAKADFFKQFPVNTLLSDQTYPEADALPYLDDQGAYVLYTSGSTGKPKGVLMGHEALVNLLLWQKDNSISAASSCTLQFAPLTFDVSFQEIFATLTTGGTLVLVDDDLRIDPVQLLQYIESQAINRIFLPFVVLQYLTEAAFNNNIFPSCLQEIMTAGEQLKITPQIISFFKALPACILYNQYGPTETHVVTQLKLVGDASLWPFLPTIGIPVANTKIIILDESFRQLPDGETGELCVAGISLAEGYLNKPGLTAEKFTNWRETSGSTTRIYRTGDLARYIPDGNIEYLGRKDTQVKIRGNRVELGEIEVLLNQLENISQAVVTASEDSSGQKRLLAYLVASDGLQNTNAVRQNMEENLPDFMLPAAYIWLNELPKTTSGKVDRKALPQPGLQRPELSSLYKVPSTVTEKNITSVWRDLLQLDRIGIDDDFFQLGGNSLLALKTIAELKQRYNYTIAVTKLYQYPTVSGLSGLLGGANKTTLLPTRKKNKDHNINRDVAIIGMAGRFPGANTIDELWDSLAGGREMISFFDVDQIDKNIPAAVKNSSAYIKARGIIDGADEFDAEFFGFNPRSAELMDPQQRIFLEIAWEVLEKTGHLPQKYSGTIGVFAGCGYNTYYDNNVLSNPEIVEKTGHFQVRLLNEKDYIATRTAHQLNLQGPAVAVYAACSTSLLAIAQAVSSIRYGQCTVAIAGAASITSPINSGHLYEEGSIMSSDGHCRPFDALATGTVFSDGAGVVLLKNMEDALLDGDTIYGVIRGIGINNDGSAKSSFSGPSAQGQAGAIAMAIHDAGIDASTISYIEAHGTATPLGDPIEIEGLNLAFGEQEKKQFCAIGSIKSNMGHLTAASGVAGLIKTVLALRNRQIPPSLFYQHINPNIDITDSPFYVNTQLAPWNTNGIRRAGVSSFGVGGTNVHVIVDEFIPDPISTGTNKPWKLICLSAKTESSLQHYTQKLGNYISQHPTTGLNDIAYTLQTTRASFNFRKVITAADNDDLLNKLNTSNTGRAVFNLKTDVSGIVFMFPGQGSQYAEMGADLYQTEPFFANAINECITLLEGTIHEDLLQLLYPAAQNNHSSDAIKQTLNTQPALFILEYAMAKLWMSWGIQPEVFIGHSIGEFVAAHLAGVFNLKDALFLVSERARLVNSVSAGSMVSVKLPENELAELLPEGLSIAAINTNKLCVVAGPENLIGKFADDLSEKGVPSRLLVISHAFHSSMMDEVIAPFEAVVRSIKLNVPIKPIISTVTGKWMSEAEATDPDYWAQHLRKTVRFADGMDTLLEDGNRLFLEVGPGNILATLARQHTGSKNVAIVPGFEKTETQSESYNVIKALGQLWLNGIEPNWHEVYQGQNRKKIDLPTYAFDRKRYWLEPAISNIAEAATETFTQQTQPSITQAIPMRKDILIGQLKEIFEDAAGIEIEAADTGLSFMEMGFDSLSLTQIATNLKKTFNTPITFRKLFEEYNSLNLLASYLDANLPPNVLKQETIHATHLASPQAAFVHGTLNTGQANNDLIISLISQQLQLLTNQLALIQNGGGIQQDVSIQNHTALTPIAAPAESKSILYELSAEEQLEIKKPFGATARIEKQTLELNDKQTAFLKELTIQYNEKTKASKAQTQKDRSYMADPRVVSGFRPLTKEIVYPLVVNRSKGSRVWDIDGNQYIDALNGFGSNFLGYQTDQLKNAVLEQVEKGYEIGPQHELAGEVCKLITEFTGFDRAALCNTGSEAVLGAMRIARTVTGRSLIVAFSGSYHGINDEVIVRGTKKLRTIPAAPGIMPEVVQNMLILDYGTEESLKVIAERAHELAAVLIEPVQSRRPDFQPIAFLKKVREITQQSETVLIFDEVITGFRMHPGGAQTMFGIKADLGTYGKVIGGGMPIGAIAGISKYMDALDGGNWQYGDDSTPEAGVTYFAGTFVRHPLALAAGKATLLYMKEQGPALQEELNARTKRLADALNGICEQYGIPVYVPHFGSLWKIKFKYELAYGELLFTLMRLRGIHIWDLFPCFLTASHTDEEVDLIFSKFEESITELIASGFMPSKKAQQPNINTNGLPINPPVPGAKLGRDADGNLGWFINDKNNPGKYLQVKISSN